MPKEKSNKEENWKENRPSAKRSKKLDPTTRAEHMVPPETSSQQHLHPNAAPYNNPPPMLNAFQPSLPFYPNPALIPGSDALNPYQLHQSQSGQLFSSPENHISPLHGRPFLQGPYAATQAQAAIYASQLQQQMNHNLSMQMALYSRALHGQRNHTAETHGKRRSQRTSLSLSENSREASGTTNRELGNDRSETKSNPNSNLSSNATASGTRPQKDTEGNSRVISNLTRPGQRANLVRSTNSSKKTSSSMKDGVANLDHLNRDPEIVSTPSTTAKVESESDEGSSVIHTGGKDIHSSWEQKISFWDRMMPEGSAPESAGNNVLLALSLQLYGNPTRTCDTNEELAQQLRWTQHVLCNNELRKALVKTDETFKNAKSTVLRPICSSDSSMMWKSVPLMTKKRSYEEPENRNGTSKRSR